MSPPRVHKIVALLQEKVRLEPAHRRLFYLSFAILWLSGAAWLAAVWLKEASLGPARTPLQAISMKIHGAAMLGYLALLGSLSIHIRRGFALRANRLSGSLVIALNAGLMVSAWILYYAADEALRGWNSVIHWTIGLAVLPLLIGHIVVGRKRSAKPNGEE